MLIYADLVRRSSACTTTARYVRTRCCSFGRSTSTIVRSLCATVNAAGTLQLLVIVLLSTIHATRVITDCNRSQNFNNTAVSVRFG